VQASYQVPVCPDCQFLHEQQFEAPEDLNFLRHCRAIRHYVDQGASTLFSPYVAAFLIAPSGRVLDIDERSTEFLRSSGVLGIRHNRVFALVNKFNELLVQAIDRVAAVGTRNSDLLWQCGISSSLYDAATTESKPYPHWFKHPTHNCLSAFSVGATTNCQRTAIGVAV
jgi:hypothetical protein